MATPTPPTIPGGRPYCAGCAQPPVWCWCDRVQAFRPSFEVALLIHPLEWRRRIATARMTHHCLEGSHAFRGAGFEGHPGVGALLRDPALHPVLLYPGPEATPLDDPAARRTLVPAGKRLLLVVVDGTWATARKMLRLSPEVAALPRVALRPREPSRMEVRRQPRDSCLTTLEAVHGALSLLGDARDRERAGHLLELQAWMVAQEQAFRRGEKEGLLPAYRATRRPEPQGRRPPATGEER